MTEQTKAEKRAAHTARCQAYEEQGYTVTDKTVSALTGNLLGILMPLPATVLLYLASVQASSRWFGPLERKVHALLFLFMVALIFLHEVTHGLFALPHCKNGWKSIHLGFNVEGLNPYCTCREPLQLKHYRQMLLGCLMFWSSGGDMLIYLLTLRFPRNTLVLDHPYLIGCTVLTKAA